MPYKNVGLGERAKNNGYIFIEQKKVKDIERLSQLLMFLYKKTCTVMIGNESLRSH